MNKGQGISLKYTAGYTHRNCEKQAGSTLKKGNFKAEQKSFQLPFLGVMSPRLEGAEEVKVVTYIQSSLKQGQLATSQLVHILIGLQ